MTLEEIYGGESDNVEFKEDIPSKSEKYLKTIIAFANGGGGKVIFGVENLTWAVKGFSKEEIFLKMDAITNAIYDSCEPLITPDISIQEVDGKQIIVLEVASGMQRPYFLKKEGIEKGTYVRVAGTTRRAESTKVRELILEGSNRSFDQLVRPETVSDEEISVFCDKLYKHALSLCETDQERKNVKQLTKNQLLSWRLLIEQNGMTHLTNGYALLDGRNDLFPDAVVQCALFKGNDRTVFISRKEFSGPIYEQISSAWDFVLQHINMGTKINGLAREDIYELPVATIREMIANAVCHRSYLAQGKVQVAIFDDRLEVTSPGMLDNDLSLEKLKEGLSKIRNRGIASAFSYLKIIEAWGSGIPRMFNEAKAYGLPPPQLIDMGNDFRVNLFRLPNGQLPTRNATIEQPTQTESEGTGVSLEENLLQAIRNNSKITQMELAQRLNVPVLTVKRRMKAWQDSGKLSRIGNNRRGEWVINDKG